MSEMLPNTPEQIIAHKAHEAKVAEEATWPLWEVVITGDEVPWVARKDEQLWHEDNGIWVPNDPASLPEGVRVEDVAVTNPDKSISMVPHIIKTARATFECRAKTEEVARMMALRDNLDYHTVVSARQK